MSTYSQDELWAAEALLELGTSIRDNSLDSSEVKVNNDIDELLLNNQKIIDKIDKMVIEMRNYQHQFHTYHSDKTNSTDPLSDSSEVTLNNDIDQLLLNSQKINDEIDKMVIEMRNHQHQFHTYHGDETNSTDMSTDEAVDLSNPKPGPSRPGRPVKPGKVLNVARENNQCIVKVEAGPSRAAQHLAAQNEQNYDKDGMVAIGYGKTLVPVRVYRNINWHSYTGATRKLLAAVFSRQMLATHSLSGKHSPAFPKKSKKAALDHIKVNDIVHTVVERCNVPEKAVRSCVTTKCADESKMYRTRQANAKKRARKENKENVR